LHRDHRRTRLHVTGDAGLLPRAFDEDAERVAVVHDLAHPPHRVAIGLAATHRDRPERADELAEPGHTVSLDLGEKVEGTRRRPGHDRDVDPREVVEREDSATLRGYALGAVRVQPGRKGSRTAEHQPPGGPEHVV